MGRKYSAMREKGNKKSREEEIGKRE